MSGLGNLAMAGGEDMWFRLEGWLRTPPRNSVWAPASHFCPAPRATEYQGRMGTSEGGQNGLPQQMWNVSISMTADHLITDLPTNSN